MSFTIGCDPELFLRNSRGEFISSVGKIGGNKWEPKVISKEGHAILEDNVAVEFNIPPANSAEEFISHINFTMQHLKQRATDLGLHFAEKIASVSFPVDELLTPQAMEFGCEPDFNAWTGKQNPKPSNVDMCLRSCGGHVHVGGVEDLDKRDLIKAMDIFLGVPSVFVDEDKRRRDLYGKAGCYREKPYGVEYRTLSNFWIWDNATMDWVYKQTEKAIEFVKKGNKISATKGALIRKAINQGDMNAAEAVVRAYI